MLKLHKRVKTFPIFVLQVEILEITWPGAMPTTPYLQQVMYDHVKYLKPIMDHYSFMDCFYRNMHRFKVNIASAGLVTMSRACKCIHWAQLLVPVMQGLRDPSSQAR